MNISSLEPGGCVLLRALEPLEEKETMTIRRLNNKKKNHGKIKDRDLCSGPSKLCQVCLNTLCTSHSLLESLWRFLEINKTFDSYIYQAFNITKELFNSVDLTESSEIWLENAVDIPDNEIVHSKRIGIESAGAEVANKLYRFYVHSNEHVSVRDKKKELLM